MNQHRPDWTFVFEPQAVIWHRVPEVRERFSYFRSRCFAEGLSKAAVTRSVGVSDGLSAERSYTARILTRGVAKGFGEALRGDPAGIERSYAISVGLLTTAAGYARGVQECAMTAMNESVPILMYHSVAQNAPAATRGLSVTPGAFDEHVAYLANHGYTGLTFSDLADAFRTGAKLAGSHGGADVRRRIRRLRPRGLARPSALQLSGDGVRHNRLGHRCRHGRRGQPLDRTLSWAQVSELSSAGIEMAAHSHSHPELDQLSDAALREELGRGRALLEDCHPRPGPLPGLSVRLLEHAGTAARLDRSATNSPRRCGTSVRPRPKTCSRCLG